MKQYIMMLVMVMLVMVYPSYSKSVDKTRLLFSQNKFHDLVNDINSRKDIKNDPKSCKPGFVFNGNYCYYFALLGLSWKNATDMCVSLGKHYGKDMTMASPYTYYDDTFLVTEAAKRREKYEIFAAFWTTGNDIRVQDKWVWGDDPKDTYLYSRWQTGEPDTPSQHCMILFNDGSPWNGWADAYCSDPRPFVCRYRL